MTSDLGRHLPPSACQESARCQECLVWVRELEVWLLGLAGFVLRVRVQVGFCFLGAEQVTSNLLGLIYPYYK